MQTIKIEYNKWLRLVRQIGRVIGTAEAYACLKQDEDTLKHLQLLGDDLMETLAELTKERD